ERPLARGAHLGRGRRRGAERPRVAIASPCGVRPGSGRAELDGGVCAEDELDGLLDHAPETTLDPAAGLGRRLRRELPPDQFGRPQPAEPEAVGGLVHDAYELRLHARPYVLELEAHGSVYPPLPGCVEKY